MRGPPSPETRQRRSAGRTADAAAVGACGLVVLAVDPAGWERRVVGFLDAHLTVAP